MGDIKEAVWQLPVRGEMGGKGKLSRLGLSSYRRVCNACDNECTILHAKKFQTLNPGSVQRLLHPNVKEESPRAIGSNTWLCVRLHQKNARRARGAARTPEGLQTSIELYLPFGLDGNVTTEASYSYRPKIEVEEGGGVGMKTTVRLIIFSYKLIFQHHKTDSFLGETTQVSCVSKESLSAAVTSLAVYD